MTDVLVADVKRVAVTGQGVVVAYASIFGNIDRMNEVVVKGAFTRSLAEWAARGERIPMLWSHQGGISDVVGVIDRAEEDDVGLKVTAQLDIENNDDAALLFEQIRRGLVSQYSFGYRVRNSRMSKGVRELTDLDLLEVSACVSGANPQTRTVSTKSAPPVGDIRRHNLLMRRIDAMRAQLDSTSSADAMSARIDALRFGAKSHGDTMKRVKQACIEAGLGWPEPQRKSSPSPVSTGRMGDAVGVLGFPNLTSPTDGRRIVVGPNMTAENLTETLAAAEEALASLTEQRESIDGQIEQAIRVVETERVRVARFDAEHRDG